MALLLKLLTQPIGYIAATCTTASFVPQVILTWRTKSAEGVSFGMYAVFVTGIALWLTYGMLTGNWPVIVANAVTLALAVCILAMKLRYD
jgi:MtN3 and saliva related transmembrane protein